MIKLLHYLIYGYYHEHNWEVIERLQIHNKDQRYIRTIYIVQCKTCGKIKRTKISHD